METLATTVVIPSVGRPSLRVLLTALAGASGLRPAATLVVDDRPAGDPIDDTLTEVELPGLRVLRSGGGGPAKARNVGWRLARTPWVSFLDDDVVPAPNWLERLGDDLSAAADDVAGISGRVEVPLPAERRPTDWERSTAGLATARWITADLTYRRSALSAVGGFDERFPRAFREDADLGLRVSRSAGRIVPGTRRITHPVRPADDWISVRQQAGNADDALIKQLHGRSWRSLVGAPAGRRPRHVAVTACAGAAAGLAVTGHPRAAAVAALGWAAGVAEFAAKRIAPGPRDAAEVRRMLITSTVIPFAATWHAASGAWQHRNAEPWRGAPDLVLFDRDGTLVQNVPYNGNSDDVVPVPGARTAVDRLRSAGIRLGVVTNQSGIASGVLTAAQVDAVNQRVEELLGPFEVWEVCPHGSDDGCACRKPAPGMVKVACQELDVLPARCVVIGDIGSDVDAAEAAGARGMLVPTPDTRLEEVVNASVVAPDLTAAVDRVLGGAW
jgi:HAD superfamily hydrolase (TIGR01662 family)